MHVICLIKQNLTDIQTRNPLYTSALKTWIHDPAIPETMITLRFEPANNGSMDEPVDKLWKHGRPSPATIKFMDDPAQKLLNSTTIRLRNLISWVILSTHAMRYDVIIIHHIAIILCLVEAHLLLAWFHNTISANSHNDVIVVTFIRVYYINILTIPDFIFTVLYTYIVCLVDL